MIRKFVDLTGRTFNRLTVKQQLPSNAQGSFWRCQCTCGVFTELPAKLITSGIVKSCGCLRRETTASRSKIDPFRALFNSLVATTKHFVGLSYEQFLEFTNESKCHYCGESIAWTAYNNRGRRLCRYNLDRMDNTLGYTAENCVVCCKRCNIGKGSMFSYEDWVEIGDLIRRQRDRKLLLERRNSVGIRGS